jgi:hypothetical protein
MSNFKVVNVKNQAVSVVETKKEVAEIISAASVTDNSVKTIEKKITAAVKNGENLYETFKIEETEEEVVMNNEVKQDEVVENEVAENQTEEEIEEVEEIESEEAAEEVEKENKDFEDRIEKDMKKGKKKDESSENEEKPNRRRVGKTLIAFKNGKEFERFDSIKACATRFKELMELPHMPFTPIMKSVRQDVDWNEYSFKFENEEDLHIPESLKKKIEESKKASDEPKKEEVKDEKSEDKSDEVIEEIEEEELA